METRLEGGFRGKFLCKDIWAMVLGLLLPFAFIPKAIIQTVTRSGKNKLWLPFASSSLPFVESQIHSRYASVITEMKENKSDTPHKGGAGIMSFVSSSVFFCFFLQWKLSETNVLITFGWINFEFALNSSVSQPCGPLEYAVNKFASVFDWWLILSLCWSEGIIDLMSVDKTLKKRMSAQSAVSSIVQWIHKEFFSCLIGADTWWDGETTQDWQCRTNPNRYRQVQQCWHFRTENWVENLP